MPNDVPHGVSSADPLLGILGTGKGQIDVSLQEAFVNGEALAGASNAPNGANVLQLAVKMILLHASAPVSGDRKRAVAVLVNSGTE